MGEGGPVSRPYKGGGTRADEGDACRRHASHRTTEPTGETIGPYEERPQRHP